MVGLAQSGAAAAEALLEHGVRVLVTEARGGSAVAGLAAELEASGAEVRTGGHEPDHLDGAEVVVTSPGVPERAPVLGWAMERGIPVWSELELGARLARSPYVLITGTNGKTTTTEMVAAAMRAGGLDAIACGNVGYPFSRAARETHDALAVEASSFQLRFSSTLRPRVSVLLNVAPDHLDWHGGYDAYREAKARVYAGQGREDVHVGNLDDPEAAAISATAPARVEWFTVRGDEAAAARYEGDRLVLRLDGREHDLGAVPWRSPGLRADAAAAALATGSFGVSPAAIAGSLEASAPLPHRGVIAARVNGITFIDDSKATNPHAALASIAGHDRVVLIAGGLAKGVDLSPLAEAVPRLRGVVVIGEAADEIAALFEGTIPVRRAADMEEAVAHAAGLARPDDVILLAPACASQDMFTDYRERGDRFAAAARGRIAHA